MDIVIYLNRNSYSITFSDTKASRKHHIILDLVFFNRLVKELNDILRALEMTGGAYTYLNYNHITVP